MSKKIKFDIRMLSRKFRFLMNPEYYRPLTILKGGSSSGKTYNLSQCVPTWILEGHNILIARESGNTLRRSIFSEIEKAIRRQGLQKYFTIRYTQLAIMSNVSTGCAMFIATSDEEKMKSITPPAGNAFDIAIMEEASEINFDSQQQIRLRMRGKTKFHMKRTYMILNPVSRNHIIYKKYYEPLDDPDNTGYIDDKIHLHHSTYLDNPHLDQAEKDVLEEMADISPLHHEVYARGMWGTMEHTIYNNWQYADVEYEDVAHLPITIGVDWGFECASANFVAYDEATKTVYMFDEVDVKQGSLDDLYSGIRERIGKYDLHNVPVLCDPAEPRSINVFKDLGLRARRAKNPAGSVLSSIRQIQQMRIVINRHLCPYTSAEISAYVFKKIGGVQTDEPKKENDHHMDAMKYALDQRLNGGKKVLFLDRQQIIKQRENV